MERLDRYQLMVDRTKMEADKILDKAKKIMEEEKNDQKKIKEMIANLKAIKINSEKDMIEIKQENSSEGEEAEYVELEWKLKQVVMKSTARILTLKDICEDIKPSAIAAR